MGPNITAGQEQVLCFAVRHLGPWFPLPERQAVATPGPP